MTDTNQTPPTEAQTNHLIAERRAKLERVREQGAAFPNDFRRDSTAEQLHLAYGSHPPEWFDAHQVKVTIAGRMMAKRVMGKASFAKVKDRSGAIQVFLQMTALGDVYEEFKGWDVGDILGAEGTLFKTKTGELTIKTGRVRLLVKSLRPLPDKWHGLADVEQRYRQRYVDLIVSDESRDVFRKRTRVIQYLRRLPRSARLHGSRDADDAGDPGRRGRKALHHPSQRARPGHVPAHRARAVPEAPRRGRLRARVRAEPQLPQRRPLDPPQSRVHDARALPGATRTTAT